MSATFREFRADAALALADPRLQQALEGATANFYEGRIQALAALPDAEALRDHFKAIRSATLAHLADHLETFEGQARAAGAQVHWARGPAEAVHIATDIAARHGVQTAVKSKSMVSEEIHLNRALRAVGITPVETDLGEWIIQLAGDPPSHIIAPAIHKTRQECAELFSREAGRQLSPDNIPELTAEARRLLREQFLAAGLGISGVNIAVAESGSVVLVTNEGNGRMVTSLPPVHIAIMGIEKLVPTWDDAAVWLSLLARSATGQPLSVYTTMITGPARPGDPDGPQEVHIIILDNKRSEMVGTAYEEALQCIRCGACLNACPVYKEAGGHSYGSPYSGPIGAVISPLLFGMEQYAALPHASSLCGACLEVCPARIDLPRMLLALRTQEVEADLPPWWERTLERAVAARFARLGPFRWLARLGRLFQTPFARNGWLRLPKRLNPAGSRRLPALARRSFRDRWESGDL
jgi:L-lactate dehydrogenase complex protein LldF